MTTGGEGSSWIGVWRRKFGDAFDGLMHGMRTESSLQVQFLFATVMLVVAAILAIELWRWAVLLICIAMVITAEYINSAIEQLVRSLNPGHKPEIAKALHLAAGAVLFASLSAGVIGIIVLGAPLKDSLGF